MGKTGDDRGNDRLRTKYLRGPDKTWGLAPSLRGARPLFVRTSKSRVRNRRDDEANLVRLEG